MVKVCLSEYIKTLGEGILLLMLITKANHRIMYENVFQVFYFVDVFRWMSEDFAFLRQNIYHGSSDPVVTPSAYV